MSFIDRPIFSGPSVVAELNCIFVGNEGAFSFLRALTISGLQCILTYISGRVLD